MIDWLKIPQRWSITRPEKLIPAVSYDISILLSSGNLLDSEDYYVLFGLGMEFRLYKLLNGLSTENILIRSLGGDESV